MRPIVSKFGGSATANAKGFQRILALLEDSPARRCAVLSAPGADAAHPVKVTSMLEECWRQRQTPDRLNPLINATVDRYGEIADALSLFDVRGMCADEILRALYISRDHTLSRGEYLCARIFGEFSGFEALDAAHSVVFDVSGRLDGPETLARLQRAIGKSARPVILPGFYGSDRPGRVVTFPRNGSDITGALAAASIEAGLYENWTDVPGLMTADPAIVPSARLIPQVSYVQMRQMARAGARVLHPACLDPVALAGIPTRLRSIFEPDSFGTLIDDHCHTGAACLTGLKAARLPESTAYVGGVCCICVFGIREATVLNAAKAIDFIAVERAGNALRIFVPDDSYEGALREMHRRLLE